MKSVIALFSLFLLVILLAVTFALLRPLPDLPLTPGEIQTRRFHEVS